MTYRDTEYLKIFQCPFNMNTFRLYGLTWGDRTSNKWLKENIDLTKIIYNKETNITNPYTAIKNGKVVNVSLFQKNDYFVCRKQCDYK